MSVVHSFPRYLPPLPAPAAPVSPSRRAIVYGVAGGLGVAAMYSGWAIVSRLGTVASVDAFDLAALRYSVSALILLPAFLRATFGASGMGGLGWGKIAVLSAGAGLPYGLAVYGGYQFAPAGHGAILLAGSIVVFTTLFGARLLGEKIERMRLYGLLAILTGIAAIGVGAFAHNVPGQWRGHALFVLAGALWAVYTVAARAWKVPPVETAAIVASLSAMAYLPFYLAFAGLRLLDLPANAVLLQAIYQGAVAGVVALILYTRVVGWLGAARAALFTALVPALANTAAPLILDEPLRLPAVLGLVLVTGGMVAAVASGPKR
jgi:drug/metabolite transporter (DMT)-like permease